MVRVSAHLRSQAPTLVSATCLAVFLSACGPADVLSGRWRGEAAPDDAAPALFPHVELRLGQFGYDVAGVVRQFDDPALRLPAEECACLYVGGEVFDGDAGTLTLDLSNCAALDSRFPDGLTIEVKATGASELEARVVRIGNEELVQTLQLERPTDIQQRVLPNERSCPADPGAGG